MRTRQAKAKPKRFLTFAQSIPILRLSQFNTAKPSSLKLLISHSFCDRSYLLSIFGNESSSLGLSARLRLAAAIVLLERDF